MSNTKVSRAPKQPICSLLIATLKSLGAQKLVGRRVSAPLVFQPQKHFQERSPMVYSRDETSKCALYCLQPCNFVKNESFIQTGIHHPPLLSPLSIIISLSSRNETLDGTRWASKDNHQQYSTNFQQYTLQHWHLGTTKCSFKIK